MVLDHINNCNLSFRALNIFEPNIDNDYSVLIGSPLILQTSKLYCEVRSVLKRNPSKISSSIMCSSVTSLLVRDCIEVSNILKQVPTNMSSSIMCSSVTSTAVRDRIEVNNIPKQIPFKTFSFV